MDVFDLMAKLTLDSSGYEKGLDDAESRAFSLGGAIKSGLVSGAKVAAAGLVSAGTAAVAMSTQATNAYADYEQLAGGIETLFKGSADTIMQYADAAYMTAGRSASEYMETAIAFSASMVNSLGGDTEAAADMINMAMTDMSDNVNKMGTDAGMVESAYRGLARSNFTMLDNLALGYAGTKEGMEQLIADAERIQAANGNMVEYSIDSYADMVQAIHVIQTEMGITGTTAEEASSTITGSTGAFKSAWKNVLTVLADGNRDIGPQVTALVDTGKQMVENIVPVFSTALKGVGDFVAQIAPTIITGLPPMLAELLPQVGNAAVSIVTAVATTIQENLPAMIDSGIEMLKSFSEGAVQGIPQLLSEVLPMIMQWTGELRANIGNIVDAGLEVLLNFLQGIINGLPELITYVPTIISNIAGIINDNGPKILAAGIELIGMLVSGIIDAVPTLIAEFPKIIQAIFDVITATNWLQLGSNVITWIQNGVTNLKTAIPETLKGIARDAINGVKSINWLDLGKSIITFIKNGVVTMLREIPNKLLDIGKSAIAAVKNIDWIGVGIAIVSGIANGIAGSASMIVDAAWNAAASALNAAKNFLGIRSPSRVFRDQVGKMMALGMGEGFETNVPTDAMVGSVEDAVGAISRVSAPTISANLEGGTSGATAPMAGSSITVNVYARQDQDEKAVAREVQRVLADWETRRRAAYA